MGINKKSLIFCLFIFSLVFAEKCNYNVIPEGGDSINQDKIPVFYSKDFILTKPEDFEITTIDKGPYIAPNIAEINLINQQYNINLLGGLSSIFKFSTPYGFAASFSSQASTTTSITAQDNEIKVSNPALFQIKVFSVSPEMNGSSSVVYNSRAFPESEFELQAPMVTYGFYGNFSSHFSLPISKVTPSPTKNDFIIDKIAINVAQPDGTSKQVADVTYKGTLETTKNATLEEFSYTFVPFLALTENIPMNVFPELSLNWNILPFGISGSYFIFSPFNVLGQKKNGEVTIGDVATGLIYYYLNGGITKEQLISGIKNVIYHTIPIKVSEVDEGKDLASSAVKFIEQALANQPEYSNLLQKAKEIVKAIPPQILNTKLKQKYLLDPFVFNGSEMLIASYFNASANQHQLYELWYINQNTYSNPALYYRDSFQTNLLAVEGVGNKIYTLERYFERSCLLGLFCRDIPKYTLNIYEVIPLGYKDPSSKLPFSTSSQNLNAPLDNPNNKKAKEDFFNSVYSEFNASWIKFFGQTIYEETHDLYKVDSIQLSDCDKFISFTSDKYTGVAYAFCESEVGNYYLYDSKGNKKLLSTTENLENAKIASFYNLLFISSNGKINNYKTDEAQLVEVGSPIQINYTDLNISAYAKYAYNKECKIVSDKADFHNIIAMSVYNGFIYLVDNWNPGCGINEVRLRMIGIGSGVDIIINPFDKEDRLNCFQTQSCGNKATAPPYGWVLASTRPDTEKEKDEKLGFQEVGAIFSGTYSANMSIDDFGRVYLITSSNEGKSLAIIDLQPFNYTLSSYAGGSLYTCISSSNKKCFYGNVDNIIYVYGSPNILNHLNQIYSLPMGSMFSGAGISANIAEIKEGMEQINEKTFYTLAQYLPPLTYPNSQTILSYSIKGKVILPFYSLYLFNQTSEITLTDTLKNIVYKPTWCDFKESDIDKIANDYAEEQGLQHQTIYYPGEKEVYARYIFSTTSQDVGSNSLQTKFESTNMVFVISTIANGMILPAFLYQKSLPQQSVSLSLFQILGLGSKQFGEAYLNVTPISAYSSPQIDERATTISKIRNFDYYTKVWKYKGIILNATGRLELLDKKDTNLQNDYYFNVKKVIQSAVDTLNTNLVLTTAYNTIFPYQYFSLPVQILNRKVPFMAFIENTLSIFANDNLLGRRQVNVTFVDLFNSTFTLPMKLDFAYSTKINATLNTSVDKNNMNLTHVTIKGNLSELIFDTSKNTINYKPLAGKVYVYVDRNINYCNKDCSKSLAEEDPIEAIKCSINGNCLLANPLNFSKKTSMETAANTINYKPSDPLEKKNTICNIYGDTYPSSCSKGYYCLPNYPNGTGYCTSQIGLVAIIDTNGNFRYDFDIYGFGLGKQIILEYYGSPSFQQTTNGYVENYAYLPTTTTLSLNYGVLPLKLGGFFSIFVILIICLFIALIFVAKKKSN